MMVRGDYRQATATLAMFLKDRSIIADFAREAGSPTPLLAATAPVYAAAAEMGYSKQDTASVCAVLESMAGHRRNRPRRDAGRKHRPAQAPPG
jgi:3-hydroxyisobutyrate dehydrogenase-like beta-hydroxyacid dehydrogenase